MMWYSDMSGEKYAIFYVLISINFIRVSAFLTDSGCSVTKSCWRSPDGCAPGSACKYFVSWKKVTQSGKNYLEMELGGTLPQSSGYIGMGFSADKFMGNDGVTVCHSSGSSVVFLSGYTTGQSAPTIITPAADYLVTTGGSPAMGGSFTSGTKYIQCRFMRLITPATSQLLNLNSGNFYILLAEGTMGSGTVLNSHSGSERWASPVAYDVSVITNETKIGTGLSLASVFKEVTATTCGTDKSCFKASDGAFVSWRPVGNMIEIEMYGKIGNGNGYMSIGFSEDAKMNNDGVVACVASPAGKVTARVAYNPISPRTNVFVTSYPNDYMVTSVAGDLLGGSYKSSGSILSCRVRRLIKPTSKVTELKDLSQPNKFYIMIARGEGSTSGGLNKHPASMAIVSATSVDMTSTSYVVLGGKAYYLAKVHGALMIIAWMMCTAIGIMLARFFKPMWPDKTLCKVKVWMQIHRSLEVICLILTVLAFILIFVEAGGYTDTKSLPEAAHPVLGIIVTILCIANPIMSLFRCAPDAPKRPIFNWAHRTVGYLAIILALPTIAIGFRMAKSGTTLPTMSAPYWIVIGYVIFLFLMFIIITLIDEKFTEKARSEVSIEMKSESDLGSSDKVQERQPKQKPKKPLIKNILLIILIVGVIIFSMTLIVFIFYF